MAQFACALANERPKRERDSCQLEADARSPNLALLASNLKLRTPNKFGAQRSLNWQNFKKPHFWPGKAGRRAYCSAGDSAGPRPFIIIMSDWCLCAPLKLDWIGLDWNGLSALLAGWFGLVCFALVGLARQQSNPSLLFEPEFVVLIRALGRRAGRAGNNKFMRTIVE